MKCFMCLRECGHGAIQKLRHSPRGGGGLDKKVTKCDKGGRGVSQKSDVTQPKNFICSFSSFCCSEVCQIHNFVQFCVTSTLFLMKIK